jgi:DUF917 family protein
MPRRKLENRQDCQDFLRGLLYYGTGGGGAEEWGMEMLTSLLEEGRSIEWVDVSEIPDDALTCTAYGTGSVSGEVPDTEAEIDALAKKKGLVNKYGHRVTEVAVRELGEYLGQEIGAIVPVELGAGNAPAPLVTGIRMGVPVVDGDFGGRAYPEEMQSTLFLMDRKPYPATIVDWWGNIMIMKEACSSEMVERIGKYISTAVHGGTFLAASVMDGRTMKETVIPGTFTLSLEVGRSIRRAVEAGQDPVLAAVEASDGWMLFDGVISGQEWQDIEGTMRGTTHIDGVGEFEGQKMKVWFMNENQVSWIDDEPFVCSPDLITIVERDTCKGYSNSEIQAGQRVAVVGMKCMPVFRTEKGLKWCGPGYYGFEDIDYVPIEEILADR